MLPSGTPAPLVLCSSHLRLSLYLNRVSGGVMEVTGDGSYQCWLSSSLD